MPDLVKANEFDDVEVFAINVRESESTVKDFIESNQYDFTTILDIDGDLASTFYVASFPTTFFVDEEGILLGSVPGMLTYEVLEELLTKIRNDEIKN